MVNSETVLSFWFGEFDALGLATPETVKRWWQKSDRFDEDVRSRFLETYEAIVDGRLQDWLQTARGRLAYIIVLDQFSRNMFRGEACMYSADAQATDACVDGVEIGHDRQLRPQERVFFYMPLMHSERLADQDRCVRLFEQLCDEVKGEVYERLSGNLKYARAHRDIVAEWGRFPHRNDILGRESSPAERAFLKQPGSSF